MIRAEAKQSNYYPRKGSGDKFGSQNDDFGGGWGSKNRSGGWDFDDKPKQAESFSQKSYDK